MRTDYFLGQNRGDDYRNSIKSYSLQAWRDAGGEDGNEPYFEEDVQRRGLDYCPVIRVYVDARIFSAWEAWKAEAERAKLGAIKGKDIYGGLAFFGGVGYSFSGNPAFLVEEIPGYGTRIWINVLCPNESEFCRAKADAEEEAARRKRHGVAVNALSDSQRTTRYCSLQNQRSELEKQLERWGGTVMRRPETPLRAISAYCLAECCLGKPHRVDACQESECPLHAFRYGTDPYREERPGGAVSSRRGRVQ